jgi:DNA polymerase-4
MIDSREVHLFHSRRSIGSERTLHEDLEDVEAIVEVLEKIAERLVERMKRSEVRGKTITLKVKYYNFKKISRSVTCRVPIGDKEIIMENVLRLIPRTSIGSKKVRLVGIRITNLVKESDIRYQQLTFPMGNISNLK